MSADITLYPIRSMGGHMYNNPCILGTEDVGSF